MAAFVPSAISTFRISHADLDWEAHRILLHYFADDHHFVETITLPQLTAPLTSPQRDAIARATRLLLLVASTSYFKTAAPQAILVEGEPLSEEEAALMTGLYREGLAQFAYENSMMEKIEAIHFEGTKRPHAPAVEGTDEIIVPLGGGKDSVVTIEALVSFDHNVTTMSVNDADPIAACADVSGLDRVIVSRQLSPLLATVNHEGALNGHVPVTAIVSMLAVIAALVRGARTVAMSNEHSASFGSQVDNGKIVNHQYSKGLEAEQLLAQAIRSTVGSNIEYFSLLRPFGELAIARSFATHAAYLPVIVSCNAAFRQNPSERTSWCRNCPKCRFVFLVLAPFVSKGRLVAAFGGNLLGDPHQLEGYQLLRSVGGHKPFECVGLESEVDAALATLGEMPQWQGDTVVAQLAPAARERGPASIQMAGALHRHSATGIPQRFGATLDAIG